MTAPESRGRHAVAVVAKSNAQGQNPLTESADGHPGHDRHIGCRAAQIREKWGESPQSWQDAAISLARKRKGDRQLDRRITSKLMIAVGSVALALPTSACSNTMAFSDTSSLVVVGHPPPPPPPPPPAPPPPPPEPKRVEVQADQIVIREKIQFETDQAVIKSESFDLLNEIARVLSDHPQIKRVSIEGHTDSAGSDKYNQKLSDKRAAAVRTYLTEHGVTADRLTSKGWGEAKPIADNADEAGREQNRRVEFIIVQQDAVKQTYEIDPSTGEKRAVKEAAPSKPEGGAK
jgi:OOP family OmpA-OmpF porin